MFLGNQVFDALDQESKRIALIVGLGFGQKRYFSCFNASHVVRYPVQFS